MYDLELLRKFCVIAKYCSFTKASNELYISQPALSKSIKLLENQMDIQLFSRNTKKTTLTKEGAILYNLIFPKLDYLCNIDSFLDNLKNKGTVELKVGCNSTITRSVLSPVLKDFLESHKNIDVSITNLSTYSLINALQKKELDLLIINLPIENIDGLNIIELMEIQDVFISGEKYAYLNKEPVSLKQLQTLPIITNKKDSITRKHFENYCLENNISITPHIETMRNSLLIDFCALGLGISFTNYNLMRKEIEENNLFVLDIKPSIPKRSIGIITRNEPQSELIRDLIDMLKIAK